MKKNILFAVLALWSVSAFSQIIVNRSDFAVANDWYVIADDTIISESTSNALKVSGTNKTWDISGWAHRHTIDTTFYADGFTYPGAPAGCNLVSFTRDPITKEEFPSYLMVNNSAVRAIIEAGTLAGSGGALKVFQFPSTMGTKFKDSTENFFTMLASDMGLSFPLVDSVKIIYKMIVNSEIDAYGKLKLDAGMFDVLRQLMVMDIRVNFKIRNTITGTYTDIPAGSGLPSMNETSRSYAWFSANGGQPLLNANEDTSGVISSMSFVLASSRGLSSGLKESKNIRQYSKVYPVPASEQITIETATTKSYTATLSVYDILGNEVIPAREVELSKGMNQLPVQVNQLKPGVYFYHLSGNGVNTSSRFVVK